MEQKTLFKIISISFRIVGYGALALAVYFLIANTVFWIRAESTTGEVVGWEYMEGIRDRRNLQHNLDPAIATVIRFQTAAGDTVVFVTDVGSGFDLDQKGEEVTVLYFEDDPENAMLRSFFSLYMGPLLLLVMGGVFGFIGVLLQFFYEPTPKKSRRNYRQGVA